MTFLFHNVVVTGSRCEQKMKLRWKMLHGTIQGTTAHLGAYPCARVFLCCFYVIILVVILGIAQ